MIIVNLQTFRTKNDSSGNPRKALIANLLKVKNGKAVRTATTYLTYSYESHRQALHENVIVESEYDYLNEFPEIEITVKEFNRIKKIHNSLINVKLNR